MRNNQYRNLSNYLAVLPTSVSGPPLPRGTPNPAIQQVVVDNLNFGFESLTHGNSQLDSNTYFTVNNAYPAAALNKCSSTMDVVCPYNTPSKVQQNYTVSHPRQQVADVTHNPVNVQRGVFRNPAQAESFINNVGLSCGQGSQGRAECVQSNTPTPYKNVAQCQATGCGGR